MAQLERAGPEQASSTPVDSELVDSELVEPEQEDVAEQLRQAVGRLVRTTRAHADTLPRTHAETLGYLSRGGPRTIAELAELRRVKHQSMSRTVGELERLGFASRASDPADRRAFVIALTAEGAFALDSDRAARRDWVAARIAAKLTTEEQRLLAAVPALLDRLADDGPGNPRETARGSRQHLETPRGPEREPRPEA
jgi:DNA-binding MarR family transcriptional regulator